MKKVVIYAPYLSNYITLEPYTFIKNLEKYGWELVESFNIENVRKLFQETCIILLVTYDGFDISTIPRSKDCILIYKYDDQHFISNTRNYIISNANYLISPYAYLTPRQNLTWIPYSCVDEYVEPLEFNNNPIQKIFLSGTVSNHYPFREYVVSLNDSRIVRLIHPGYDKNYSKDTKGVGFDYLKTLHTYLCCFVDASKYNYTMLKNFEIAAAGSLLLTDKALGGELYRLGFIDNETCILCDKSTFLDKISYILDPSNREVIDKIRLAGMKLARAKHLTSHRSLEFNNFVNESITTSITPIIDTPTVILI